VAALVAAVAGAWLLQHDGTWDTYRTPLFWPFVFTTGLVTVLSTSETADDPRAWRTLIACLAMAAALLIALAARLAAANPINDIRRTDIASLAALGALLMSTGGLAATLAHRAGAVRWRKTAWCLAACLFVMWLIPRLALFVHQRIGA
jgi:hypothetical protein